jgi:hypothetical protein
LASFLEPGLREELLEALGLVRRSDPSVRNISIDPISLLPPSNRPLHPSHRDARGNDVRVHAASVFLAPLLAPHGEEEPPPRLADWRELRSALLDNADAARIVFENWSTARLAERVGERSSSFLTAIDDALTSLLRLAGLEYELEEEEGGDNVRLELTLRDAGGAAGGDAEQLPAAVKSEDGGAGVGRVKVKVEGEGAAVRPQSLRMELSVRRPDAALDRLLTPDVRDMLLGESRYVRNLETTTD